LLYACRKSIIRSLVVKVYKWIPSTIIFRWIESLSPKSSNTNYAAHSKITLGLKVVVYVFIPLLMKFHFVYFFLHFSEPSTFSNLQFFSKLHFYPILIANYQIDCWHCYYHIIRIVIKIFIRINIKILLLSNACLSKLLLYELLEKLFI